MKWVLIGVAGFVLGVLGGGWPAAAMPMPASAVGLAPAPAAMLPVRYHRHYRHHRYRAYESGSAAETAARGAIKPGAWQFTAQLPGGTMPPLPSGTRLPPGAQGQSGGAKTTYTACIRSDQAVPVQLGPQCKLDNSESGPRISWSMTCTNARGAVHSDGTGQYHGDTMEATMVSHLPGPNGAVTELRQLITGRYLGPCPLQAATPTIPPSANAAAGSSASWIEPAPGSGTKAAPASAAPAPPSGTTEPAPPIAATEPAAPTAAARAASAPAAEPEPPMRSRHRYAHYRHHRHRWHRRHWGRWGGGFAASYARLGPAPNSPGGP